MRSEIAGWTMSNVILQRNKRSTLYVYLMTLLLHVMGLFFFEASRL